MTTPARCCCACGNFRTGMPRPRALVLRTSARIARSKNSSKTFTATYIWKTMCCFPARSKWKRGPRRPRMPDNVRREARLQRAVTAYIVTGLFFMLLPGTFLGVWNLVTVSNRRALESLSPAWVQAHGHAQVFGWIGTFVLGIGAYSLSKMGRLPAAAVRRSWLCYWLWTGGVSLRWVANITAWQWRVLLPVSALLEMAGFLVFFATVSGHKPAADSGAKPM